MTRITRRQLHGPGFRFRSARLRRGGAYTVFPPRSNRSAQDRAVSSRRFDALDSLECLLPRHWLVIDGEVSRWDWMESLRTATACSVDCVVVERASPEYTMTRRSPDFGQTSYGCSAVCADCCAGPIGALRPHGTRVGTNTTNEALASSRPTGASAEAGLAMQTK